jgi:2-dehydro-3-deoxygluconokinase
LGDKLYHSGNMKCVVFKDGSRGAWCYDGDRILQILPENAICVDPIGAGDAFNAGFLYGILHDFSYPESGKIAWTARFDRNLLFEGFLIFYITVKT